ncbi:MAG: heme ABC transporter ATP-binding protein [Chloroflexaceae bacterium]
MHAGLSPNLDHHAEHRSDLSPAAQPAPPLATRMPAPLLEVRDVSYSIDGVTLVDTVSLALQPGEVLVIVGPNGAGKTTLLSLLTGDVVPSAGTVLLDGVPLPQITPRAQAQARAVMRQRITLSFPFTVQEVVLMGRNPHLQQQGEVADDYAITRRALEATEMRSFEERSFPTLSGGEQTRVTLARILAQTAPILLLDEPTAALDLRHQYATMQLARAVATAGGAVLAILHDLNLAATYADRIGLMTAGRLCTLGTPWEVLDARLLEQVYRVPIVVQPHPTMDIPLVLVSPGTPA